MINLVNHGGLDYLKFATILFSVSLVDNDLDGEIPQKIGSLASLQQLNVYDNIFTGSIPASIASLQKIVI